VRVKTRRRRRRWQLLWGHNAQLCRRHTASIYARTRLTRTRITVTIYIHCIIYIIIFYICIIKPLRCSCTNYEEHKSSCSNFRFIIFIVLSLTLKCIYLSTYIPSAAYKQFRAIPVCVHSPFFCDSFAYKCTTQYCAHEFLIPAINDTIRRTRLRTLTMAKLQKSTKTQKTFCFSLLQA